jgi:hypothetical protein
MTSESLSSGAGGTTAGSSSFRTVLSVLVSPREGFAALARRPAWLLALVLLTLCAATALHVSLSKVTAEDVMRAAEASGRAIPPEADPERILAFTRWSQLTFAILGAPIFYLIEAALLLFAFRMSGSDLRFRESFATTIHGMLPFGVAAILGAIVASFRETITLEEMKWGGVLASNLGILAGEETGSVARALLTSVDAFSIWCVVLLATGYEIVARVPRRTAWTGVLAVWAAGIALKVVFAALGPG